MLGIQKDNPSNLPSVAKLLNYADISRQLSLVKLTPHLLALISLYGEGCGSVAAVRLDLLPVGIPDSRLGQELRFGVRESVIKSKATLDSEKLGSFI